MYIVSRCPDAPEASSWLAVVQEKRPVRGSANVREDRCMNDSRYVGSVFVVELLEGLEVVEFIVKL